MQVISVWKSKYALWLLSLKDGRILLGLIGLYGCMSFRWNLTMN